LFPKVTGQVASTTDVKTSSLIGSGRDLARRARLDCAGSSPPRSGRLCSPGRPVLNLKQRGGQSDEGNVKSNDLPSIPLPLQSGATCTLCTSWCDAVRCGVYPRFASQILSGLAGYKPRPGREDYLSNSFFLSSCRLKQSITSLKQILGGMDRYKPGLGHNHLVSVLSSCRTNP
jgi:hypothetical protein